MDSIEIRKEPFVADGGAEFAKCKWLKEIAYQLAVMNEQTRRPLGFNEEKGKLQP